MGLAHLIKKTAFSGGFHKNSFTMFIKLSKFVC